MRKYLFLMLLFPLILGSCNVDWNNEKDKKISELEKQVQEFKKLKENDVFKKKQECAKYLDQINKKIEKEVNEYSSNGDLYHEYIYEIFYSEKFNSCYAYTVARIQYGQSEMSNYNIIYNILTNEKTIYDKKDKDNTSQFYKELNELKQK